MKLKAPSMIIFDYGQTLVDEGSFDGVAGTEAVMKYAVSNRFNLGAAEVQAKADEFNKLIGRYDPELRYTITTETHNHPFQRLLYEILGIELSLTSDECEDIFWRAATPGAKPCDGISELLELLGSRGIRTGVISNISFSGRALKKRLGELLPCSRFEFVIASSEYVFRKPSPILFELVSVKSGLGFDEIWYCGDQPRFDIAGAHGVGMKCVLYTGAHDGKYGSCVANGKCGADIVISNWHELADMFIHN